MNYAFLDRVETSPQDDFIWCLSDCSAIDVGPDNYVEIGDRIKSAVGLFGAGVLKAMLSEKSYLEYLTTPYWKYVSFKCKQRDGYKCVLCDSRFSLNAHHKRYDNRGDELNHMEDLICMCRKCHEKQHLN